MPPPAPLGALRATWSAALETGLVASVDSARAYATRRGGDGGGGGEAAWRDYETLALCRLALGRGWAAPAGYTELSMATLDAHAAALSTAGQARVRARARVRATPNPAPNPNPNGALLCGSRRRTNPDPNPNPNANPN